VASGILHVFKGHAGFTGARDEGDPQRVRGDLAGTIEGCTTSEPAHHAPGLGLVHAPARAGDEQGTGRATVEVGVKRPDHRASQDRTVASAALAFETQDSVPVVVRQVLDVS
jgi:hypothetical protein